MHEGKCRHLHGHNYQVFFHARNAGGLDNLGRVVDFGVLKDKFGRWIEENWDHGFIVWQEDGEALAALKQIPDQKIFVLPANPTAENMALYLLNDVAGKLLEGTAAEIVKVVLWETENCSVEVQLAN